MNDLAQISPLHQLAELQYGRIKAHVVIHREHRAATPDHPHQLGGFGRRHRERFLAHARFPGRQRRERHRVVMAVRCRDMHHVHVW